MFETVQLARAALEPQGWHVQTVQSETHGEIYQLYNGAGEYIVSGRSPGLAWIRAFLRGLLVVEE